MYKVLKLKHSIVFVSIFLSVVFVMSILVTAKAAKAEQVEIPIIMYHSILQDSDYHGDYVISPDDFEQDLIYLQENGYTAIGIQDLIDYTNGISDLPEKPIILSFDDGYYNNYLYAYPLAVEYEMKIIISPIAYYSEQCSLDSHLSANYSHCTAEQISEMYNSGYVDFGNHTYNLHSTDAIRKGVTKVTGESDEDYREILTQDITTAQELLLEWTGTSTELFVYPFGAVSDETPDIISDLGFTITFSCEEKTNIITREISSLEYLGRYLRPVDKSVQEILE